MKTIGVGIVIIFLHALDISTSTEYFIVFTSNYNELDRTITAKFYNCIFYADFFDTSILDLAHIFSGGSRLPRNRDPTITTTTITTTTTVA